MMKEINRKSVVVLAAALGAAVLQARPAQAGKWVVDRVECTGGYKESFGNMIPGVAPGPDDPGVYIHKFTKFAADDHDYNLSAAPPVSVTSGFDASVNDWQTHLLTPGSFALSVPSLRAIVKWVPDNAGDLPPRVLYFRQKGRAQAIFTAGSGPYLALTRPLNVDLFLDPGVGGKYFAGDPGDAGVMKSVEGTEFKRIFNPARRPILVLPVVTQQALVNANDPERGGHLEASRSYEVNPFRVFAKRPQPSPEGDPVLKGNPDNEFVLHGQFPDADQENNYGLFHPSRPLRIQARIGVDGEDIDFDTLNFVRQKSDWRLTRPIPHPLTRIENGQQPLSSNSGEVFPQVRTDFPGDVDESDPNLPPQKLHGLGFSGKYFLPESNSEFGGRVIEHIHQDNVVGRSPIEIFFSATEKEHQPSDDLTYCLNASLYKDADHRIKEFLTPVVPNWYYYYNQLCVNQWNVPISYLKGNISVVKSVIYEERPPEVPTPAPTPTQPPDEDPNPQPEAYQDDYPEGVRYTVLWVQDHAHIGDGGHGTHSTDLFATVNDSQFIKYVGEEDTKGLDYFSRLITHEAAHKRLLDAVMRREDGHVSPDDLDNDLVPDAIEDMVGLDSSRRMTDPFWIAGYLDGEDGLGYICADAEILPRICEDGLFADPVGVSVSRDWADDGLNRGTPVTSPPGPGVPPTPGTTIPPNMLQRTSREIFSQFLGKRLTFKGELARAAIP